MVLKGVTHCYWIANVQCHEYQKKMYPYNRKESVLNYFTPHMFKMVHALLGGQQRGKRGRYTLLFIWDNEQNQQHKSYVQ